MASVNGSVIQGNFLHGLPRPALHGPAARGVAPPGPRPPIQRMANGSAVQVPVSPGFFGTGMGQRLPETIQRKMESLFGARFDDVRIHIGPQATSLGALAFTHGSNIYFAHGQYNPQTAQGQRLLGHELTHVVQQRSGRARNPFGAGVAVLQDPALEAEAERMGLRAAAPEMGRMPAPPPAAVQRKPAMGAASRVLQPRILPVPQPVRRGVLQMVFEEELQALSMLFKAYELSQGNEFVAGEIQAMYINGNVVLASNSTTDLESVWRYLQNKKKKDIAESLQGMHVEAVKPKKQAQFPSHYNFLFAEEEASQPGKQRAEKARDLVHGKLLSGNEHPFTDTTEVFYASSVGRCADSLYNSRGKVIILASDHRHHAEQQLVAVIALLLSNGFVPNYLGIRGVRAPCSACHAVLMSFSTALSEVYSRNLSYLPVGEGTEAERLDLKGTYSGTAGKFGRFIEIYDELLFPGKYRFSLGYAGDAAKAVKALKNHLSTGGYEEAKMQLLAGYNQNLSGDFSVRRRNDEASPVVFLSNNARENKDRNLSQLLTELGVLHEPPSEIEEEADVNVNANPLPNLNLDLNIGPNPIVNPIPNLNPNPNPNGGQNQGLSMGTVARNALILGGIGLAVAYGGPTMYSYASSYISSLFQQKEDPSRKRPSLPVPPGRRKRPLSR